ncbi:hypothetical protein BDW22DRAFT_369446 [Trametopsis cervina]|nr:hypothetical protein BDW22DRAFT_369446 [Trametopsis cervina]
MVAVDVVRTVRRVPTPSVRQSRHALIITEIQRRKNKKAKASHSRDPSSCIPYTRRGDASARRHVTRSVVLQLVVRRGGLGARSGGASMGSLEGRGLRCSNFFFQSEDKESPFALQMLYANLDFRRIDERRSVRPRTPRCVTRFSRLSTRLWVVGCALSEVYLRPLAPPTPRRPDPITLRLASTKNLRGSRSHAWPRKENIYAPADSEVLRGGERGTFQQF